MIGKPDCLGLACLRGMDAKVDRVVADARGVQIGTMEAVEKRVRACPAISGLYQRHDPVERPH